MQLTNVHNKTVVDQFYKNLYSRFLTVTDNIIEIDRESYGFDNDVKYFAPQCTQQTPKLITLTPRNENLIKVDFSFSDLVLPISSSITSISTVDRSAQRQINTLEETIQELRSENEDNLRKLNELIDLVRERLPEIEAIAEEVSHATFNNTSEQQDKTEE